MVARNGCKSVELVSKGSIFGILNLTLQSFEVGSGNFARVGPIKGFFSISMIFGNWSDALTRIALPIPAAEVFSRIGASFYQPL